MVTGHGDGAIQQIADDLFHIPANVADFGEFGSFDLEEGRTGQFGQSSADLGLADASWPDH